MRVYFFIYIRHDWRGLFRNKRNPFYTILGVFLGTHIVVSRRCYKCRLHATFCETLYCLNCLALMPPSSWGIQRRFLPLIPRGGILPFVPRCLPSYLAPEDKVHASIRTEWIPGLHTDLSAASPSVCTGLSNKHRPGWLRKSSSHIFANWTLYFSGCRVWNFATEVRQREGFSFTINIYEGRCAARKVKFRPIKLQRTPLQYQTRARTMAWWLLLLGNRRHCYHVFRSQLVEASKLPHSCAADRFFLCWDDGKQALSWGRSWPLQVSNSQSILTVHWCYERNKMAWWIFLLGIGTHHYQVFRSQLVRR